MTAKILPLAFILGFAFTFWTAQANAQECTTPGTVAFPDIAESRADIIPSVHRQLSSLGRLAKANGCSVVVTCAADPLAGEAGKKSRDRKCAAARNAIGWYERRNAIRTDLVKTYEAVKVNASAEWAAGGVYVTLQ